MFNRLTALDAINPVDLSRFVEEDLSHKDLVVRVAERESVRREDLSVPRLEALLALESDFGRGSKSLAELLVLERQGASLSAIAGFLHEGPDAKQLLESLLRQSAPPDRFAHNQLYARLHLDETLGSESAAMARILDYREPCLDLAALWDFLDGQLERNSSEPIAGLQERRQVLEKLLSENSSAQALTGSRLQSLVDLNRVFAANPEAMKRILEAENSAGVSLADLRNLNDAKIGGAILEKFTSGSDSVDKFQPVSWSYLKALEDRLQPDQAIASRFAELIHDGLDPRGLTEHLFRGNLSASLLEKQIREGATAKQLDADRLLAVGAIKLSFGDRPEVIARLLRLEEQGMDLKPLSDFIGANHSHENVIAEQVLDGASAAELLPARLSALEWAQRFLEPSLPRTRVFSL